MGDILVKADINLRESIKNIAENSPNGQIIETDDYLIFTIGRPTTESHANGVFCLNDSNYEFVFEIADKFFKERKLDYVFWINSDTNKQTEKYLKEKGYLPRREPGVAIMSINDKIDTPEVDFNYRLTKVKNSQEIRDYITVVRDSFDLEENIAVSMFNSEKVLNSRVNEAYLIYKNNMPVSAVQVYKAGGVSGIYWVSTLEEERGQGLGKLITSVGTNAGFEMDSDTVVLQASQLGQYVYEKLGYNLIGYYRTYQIKLD